MAEQSPTGRIVYSAPKQHHCYPGYRIVRRKPDWYHTELDLLERNDWGTQAGSVWQCGCGRTWVAYYLKPSPTFIDFSVHWRPEGRVARWWRRRRLAGPK